MFNKIFNSYTVAFAPLVILVALVAGLVLFAGYMLTGSDEPQPIQRPPSAMIDNMVDQMWRLHEPHPHGHQARNSHGFENRPLYYIVGYAYGTENNEYGRQDISYVLGAIVERDYCEQVLLAEAQNWESRSSRADYFPLVFRCELHTRRPMATNRVFREEGILRYLDDDLD